jgi:hypothetical protein
MPRSKVVARDRDFGRFAELVTRNLLATSPWPLNRLSERSLVSDTFSATSPWPLNRLSERVQ